MTKKKEIKRPSTKEKKPVKHNNKGTIFDGNGKLIVNKTSEKTSDEQMDEAEKNIEMAIHRAMKHAGKKPLPSLSEMQEKKRVYWRRYYSQNKSKYKQWNNNWRAKQKTQKLEEKTKK